MFKKQKQPELPNRYAGDRFDEPGEVDGPEMFAPKKSTKRVRAKLDQCRRLQAEMVAEIGTAPVFNDHYQAAIDVLAWVLGEAPSPSHRVWEVNPSTVMAELEAFRDSHYSSSGEGGPNGQSYFYALNAYKCLLWVRFGDDDLHTADGASGDPAEL